MEFKVSWTAKVMGVFEKQIILLSEIDTEGRIFFPQGKIPQLTKGDNVTITLETINPPPPQIHAFTKTSSTLYGKYFEPVINGMVLTQWKEHPSRMESFFNIREEIAVIIEPDILKNNPFYVGDCMRFKIKKNG